MSSGLRRSNAVRLINALNMTDTICCEPSHRPPPPELTAGLLCCLIFLTFFSVAMRFVCPESAAGLVAGRELVREGVITRKRLNRKVGCPGSLTDTTQSAPRSAPVSVLPPPPARCYYCHWPGGEDPGVGPSHWSTARGRGDTQARCHWTKNKSPG